MSGREREHAPAGGPATAESEGGGGLRTRAPEAAMTSAFAVDGGERAPAPRRAEGAGLIVDDEVATLAPGQMRKLEFLDHLHRTACATAERELAAVGRSATGCPYIDALIERYQRRPAASVERAVRRYAPGGRAAMSAEDYLPAVADKLGRGVAAWVSTGQMPGDAPDVTGLADDEGAGGAGGGIGALFATSDGSPRGGVDAAALAARLGPGRPLDGAARGRMEGALGHSFAGVRIHADDRAATLARGLDARAFTVGEHIAFGSGELAPGTPHGDALLAHELTHVAQQDGAVHPAAAAAPVLSTAAAAPLEREADDAAVDAVASLWGPAGLRGAARTASTRARTPLRLQRCGASPSPANEYERLVVEGTRKLQDPHFRFGLPWEGKADCGAPENGQGNYDHDFWHTEKVGNDCALVTTAPATAISALFSEERRPRWQIDCGIFAQLPHYYALLKLEGATKFDARFPGTRLELKKQFSTGLRSREYWYAESRGSKLVRADINPATGAGPKSGFDPHLRRDVPVKPASPVEVEEDVLLARVPVGSRITFGTYSDRDEAGLPAFDNTSKMANDLYATHDVPKTEDTMLSKERMVEELRKKYNPYPPHAGHVRIVAVEVFVEPTSAPID